MCWNETLIAQAGISLYPNLYDNITNLLQEYFRDPLVKWQLKRLTHKLSCSTRS